MHRTVVAFQNLPFLPIHSVHPHPLVTSAAGDEPVTEDRVQGRR